LLAVRGSGPCFRPTILGRRKGDSPKNGPDPNSGSTACRSPSGTLLDRGGLLHWPQRLGAHHSALSRRVNQVPGSHTDE